MSLGYSRLGLLLVLAALGASNLLVNNAIGQGKAQSRRVIELSETNSTEILTNLNQLSTKKEESRQLDEQLRLLKELTTPKSMETRFSIPYVAPTVLPNKRIKELIERQKNWALTPEDLNFSAGKNSPEADVSSFEGTDKMGGKNTSLEQFYDTLNRSGSSAPSSGRKDDGSTPSGNKRSILGQENNTDDDSSLPPEVRDKTERLKELVNGDRNSLFNPGRVRSSFDNFFGVNGQAQTAGQGAANKPGPAESFLDQYKKGLDPSVAAGLDPTLKAVLPEVASHPKATFVEPFKAPTTGPRRDENEPTPGQVNSVLDVTSVSDINSAVLNQWNPLYTPPKVEVRKYAPPTPPNLEFPRRKF
jgi:hypothetical protein